MIYLVDTNVLLRFADRTDSLRPAVRSAIRALRAEGHVLQATSQNFAEFWNAATRPADKNGWGLTPESADRWLRFVERIFRLLPDSPTIYPEWRRLVVAFGVSGVKVYDARLVAAMLVYGITHIVTLNPADFARYASIGIVAVDPRTLAPAP